MTTQSDLRQTMPSQLLTPPQSSHSRSLTRPSSSGKRSLDALSPLSLNQEISPSHHHHHHHHHHIPRPRTKLNRLKELGAETRAELRRKIRDDWEWPVLTPGTQSPSATARPNSKSTANAGATKWVLREPGSDEDELGDYDDTSRAFGGGDDEAAEQAITEETYKFESPDAVGEEVARRKRQRRARVAAELQWNEGLAVFEARRNAWTGAVLKPQGWRPEEEHRNNEGSGQDAAAGAPASPPPSREQPTTEISGTSALPNAEGSTLSSSHRLMQPMLNGTTPPNAPATIPLSSIVDPDLVPYLPIPPPLIPPDHPIRAEITSRTYPHIYSRVVVQGTSPAVPINLADMTRATVAGWQADNEWPPKPAPLDPLAGRRKPQPRRAEGEGKKDINGIGKDGGGLVSGLRKVLRITAGGKDGHEKRESVESPREAPALLGD